MKELAKEIYMKGGASEYELMSKYPMVTKQDIFDWDAEKGLLIDTLPFFIPKSNIVEVHRRYIVIKTADKLMLPLKKKLDEDLTIQGIFLSNVMGMVLQGKDSLGGRLKFSATHYNGNFHEASYQFVIPKQSEFVLEANGPGEKRLYLERK